MVGLIVAMFQLLQTTVWKVPLLARLWRGANPDGQDQHHGQHDTEQQRTAKVFHRSPFLHSESRGDG